METEHVCVEPMWRIEAGKWIGAAIYQRDVPAPLPGLATLAAEVFEGEPKGPTFIQFRLFPVCLQDNPRYPRPRHLPCSTNHGKDVAESA